MRRCAMLMLVVLMCSLAAHAEWTKGAFTVIPEEAGKKHEALGIQHVQYSPDGRLLVMEIQGGESRGRVLALFDLQDLRARVQPLQPSFYESQSSSYTARPTFSPDGRVVAFCPSLRLLRLWDARANRRVLDLTLPVAAAALGIAFSSDGRTLAVSQNLRGASNVVTIWDLRTGTVSRTLRVNGLPITHARFSPDARSLALLSDITRSDTGQTMKLYLFDWRTGRRLGYADTHSNVVFDVAFAHDGRALYSLDGDGLQEWRVPSLALARYSKMPVRGSFSHVAVSPDDAILCIKGVDNAVIWDIRARRAVGTFPGALAADLSPDGRQVWILDKDFRVSAVDVRSGKTTRVAHPSPSYLRPLDFSPPAYGARPWFTVRSPVTGNVVATFQILAAPPRGLEWIAYTPAGMYARSDRVSQHAYAMFAGKKHSFEDLDGKHRRPADVRMALLHPESQVGARESTAATVPAPSDSPRLTRVKPVVLTPEKQEARLAQRLKTGGDLLSAGRLGLVCELLYAVEHILLSSDEKDIGDEPMANPFPAFYHPTWREALDSIARQTLTTWTYSGTHGAWLLRKPAPPLPFTFTLAPAWESEDRGLYLFCKPPVAPVGLDVYILGDYSFPKDPEANMRRVRDTLAMMFARPFRADAAPDKMQPVQVDGAEALYFEAPSPVKPETTWRQWAFTRRGAAFVIVSSIDRVNEDKVLPDVKAMVASFRYTGK